MTNEELLKEVTEAILNGTLFRVVIKGKLPKGFPRGELLCSPRENLRTYLMCPIKVANWIYQRQKNTNELTQTD
jgi:hypothetical protein